MLTLQALLILATVAISVAFIYLVNQRRVYKRRATYDFATNILNRQALEAELAKLVDLSRRKNHTFALLLVDFDHFKGFNDTYGHAAGDRMMRAFTRVVEEEIRTYDTFARWGGEEFVLLLPETNLGEARAFAERLRRVVAETVNITVSVGVAVYPQDGETQEDLFERADQAMYKAKEKRNTVVAASEL